MSKNINLNCNLETSKYFSALEIPDGLIFESDHDENYYDSYKDNYYSPLLLNQMNSIDEYYSLKFQANNDLEKNQNLYGQEDFKSCEYVKTLLDSVRELETDCTRIFMKRFKDKRIKDFSLDQTIEQVLDEFDYESKLESLIRDHVCSNSNSINSSNGSNSYLQLNPYPNSFETIKSMNINNDFILLEHCYNLLKNSNIKEMFKLYNNQINSFKEKLIMFIEKTKNETVKSVGYVLFYWINLDLITMTLHFKKLETKEKWCLIKNLLYYALKLILFNYSYSNNNYENASSFCLILNSIYNFVKYFEIISA